MSAGLLAAACVAAHAVPARAVVPTGFSDQLVASGFDSPVGLAFLPDGRALVIEQSTARIRMVRDGVVTTIGTVPTVRIGGERGLLGIAVDPEWPDRPYLYVHSTYNSAFEIRISRFAVHGDLENTGTGQLTVRTTSRYDLLTGIPDVQSNHNGGTVRFGPDGMLYVSIGDDAVNCDAQVLSELQGKILRLDVQGLPADSGGPPPRSQITPAGNPFVNGPTTAERLVWAYGLRNPFRFSMDPVDGSLYVADVGETEWEEMNEVAAAGENLGWPWYEGFEPFNDCGDVPGPTLEPIHVYDHSRQGQEAIIAGPLVRWAPSGTGRFPIEYDGDVFFSEYYKGELVRLTRSGGTWVVAPPVPGQPTNGFWGTGYAFVPDYEVGPDGGIWYCRQSTGELRRIVAVPPSGSVGDIRPVTAPAGWYDIQGRRVDRPGTNGVFFKKGSRRTVVR